MSRFLGMNTELNGRLEHSSLEVGERGQCCCSCSSSRELQFDLLAPKW